MSERLKRDAKIDGGGLTDWAVLAKVTRAGGSESVSWFCVGIVVVVGPVGARREPWSSTGVTTRSLLSLLCPSFYSGSVIFGNFISSLLLLTFPRVCDLFLSTDRSHSKLRASTSCCLWRLQATFMLTQQLSVMNKSCALYIIWYVWSASPWCMYGSPAGLTFAVFCL